MMMVSVSWSTSKVKIGYLDNYLIDQGFPNLEGNIATCTATHMHNYQAHMQRQAFNTKEQQPNSHNITLQYFKKKSNQSYQ